MGHPPCSERPTARERGAALVELAIALPVLTMLLLGTFTSGMAVNDDLQLTHAAREGARYGATVPDGETFSSGTWADNVQAMVVVRFGDDLSSSGVCVALVEGASATPLSAGHTTESDGTRCFDDSASGVVDARVQVAVEKSATIDTGLFATDIDLSSQATAKHESNG